jgi:hypothetical protein
LKSSLPRQGESFAKIVRLFIALAALIGLAGCGAGDYSAARDSSRAVAQHSGPGSETPGSLARLETEKIRYSQESYSVSGGTEDGSTYTVEENIQWLKDHPGQDFPWGGPIRVFRKQAFMDEWGPLTRNRFTGDPKNLESGEIYTLDHRRLVAYRLAARKTIPVEWADLKLVRDQRWRFTTPNRGRSIAATP